MADLDDIETRDAEEIMEMVTGGEKAQDKLGVGAGGGGSGGEPDPDTNGGSETEAESDEGSGDDTSFNPFEEPEEEQQDPREKNPFDVSGVTEERVEEGRAWMRQMIEDGNQVNQWRFGEEDPAIQIIVPSDIYPKVEYVSQQARTAPGTDRGYGMSDPAFAEDAPIHPASLTAFHYILDDGDDFDSGPYDIEGIISAIEADGEPFLLLYNEMVEKDAVPLDTTQ